MWGPSLIPPFSFLQKLPTFFLINVNFTDFTARLNSHDMHSDSVVSVTPKQKFAGPLVGAPVQPNMPISASELLVTSINA